MTSPDYGTRGPLTFPRGWSDRADADMTQRRRASGLITALAFFSSHLADAVIAEEGDDPASAGRSRAMAMAALHEHPGLLQLINPENKT